MLLGCVPGYRQEPGASGYASGAASGGIGPDESYSRIVSDVTISAAFQSQEDHDEWAAVNISDDPVHIIVETSGPDGAECGVDTEIRVFADFGEGLELARDDDGGIGLCSKVSLDLPGNGTVFLDVSALSPVPTDGAPYLLRVSFLPVL